MNIQPANIFTKQNKPANPTTADQVYIEVTDVQFFIPTCASPKHIDNAII